VAAAVVAELVCWRLELQAAYPQHVISLVKSLDLPLVEVQVLIRVRAVLVGNSCERVVTEEVVLEREAEEKALIVEE
jgi:hypothetical protein